VSIELCDTETFRIGDFFQEHVTAALASFDRRREIVEEDVVTEESTHLLMICEFFGKPQCLRDATGFFLHFEGEGAPEARAGSEECRHLIEVLGARDHGDVLDPRAQEDMQRVEDERFVIHRQQALVRHVREGAKSGTGAAADQNSFHELGV
jgi:hypothetical protein